MRRQKGQRFRIGFDWQDVLIDATIAALVAAILVLIIEPFLRH